MRRLPCVLAGLLLTAFSSSEGGMAVVIVESEKVSQTETIPQFEGVPINPSNLYEILSSTTTTNSETNKTQAVNLSEPQEAADSSLSVEDFSSENESGGQSGSGSFEDYYSGENELQVDSPLVKVNDGNETRPEKFKNNDADASPPEVQESRNVPIVLKVGNPKDLKAEATGYEG